MSSLTKSPEWIALQSHCKSLSRIQMREFFAQEPQRFERLSLEMDGLLLDYSKNRLTTRTLDLLAALADAADLGGWIGRLFRGDKVNNTEGRAALHMALRDRSDRPYPVDGRDARGDVAAGLARIADIAGAVRGGAWLGYSGKPIRDVLSIGIGGSHLGPEMAAQALWSFADGPRIQFVANVDGSAMAQALKGLDPGTTLFLIVSKTFTTSETMANAEAARRWFRSEAGGEAGLSRHFIAVSANMEAARAFGIDPANCLEMWDWVGGRYSLWSAVGLPLALAVGFERFAELLDGGHAMDAHFAAADVRKNMPALLALIGVWYGNFFGFASQAVIPYDEGLRRFPAYLQQLIMESLGKQTSRDGESVDHPTAPIVWGEPGTNAQHSFFQSLHQGPAVVPVDFLVAAANPAGDPSHHELLLANALAQAEALMRGKTAEELRVEMERVGKDAAEIRRLLPHRVCPGNRPSNMLVYPRLDPRSLGMLVALYEHRTFAQGVIWRLNAFDQWGVELGKLLAAEFVDRLRWPEWEAGTGLLARIRAMQAKTKGPA
jgi:glucose-6-phosphate isomerase